MASRIGKQEKITDKCVQTPNKVTHPMKNLKLTLVLSLSLFPFLLLGNSRLALPEFSFSVMYTSAMPLICKPYLSVELLYVGDIDRDGDGFSDHISVDIPATDLLEMPSLDTTDQSHLQYSINIQGDTVNQQQDTLILTCRDYARIGEMIPVEVHAWDRSERIGTCTSYLFAQHGHATCEQDELIISTSIISREREGIPGVSIVIEGGPNDTFQTDANGKLSLYDYQWTNLLIEPELESNPLQGVSTVDIILMHAHIIGREVLKNPYELIAADINNDGRVSTRDIVELQRLLLGTQREFLANTSWRFICSEWSFPNQSEPWDAGPFPERKTFNTFVRSLFVEFIAVKIGDVSGDVLN